MYPLNPHFPEFVRRSRRQGAISSTTVPSQSFLYTQTPSPPIQSNLLHPILPLLPVPLRTQPLPLHPQHHPQPRLPLRRRPAHLHIQRLEHINNLARRHDADIVLVLREAFDGFVGGEVVQREEDVVRGAKAGVCEAGGGVVVAVVVVSVGLV